MSVQCMIDLFSTFLFLLIFDQFSISPPFSHIPDVNAHFTFLLFSNSISSHTVRIPVPGFVRVVFNGSLHGAYVHCAYQCFFWY